MKGKETSGNIVANGGWHDKKKGKSEYGFYHYLFCEVLMVTFSVVLILLYFVNKQLQNDNFFLIIIIGIQSISHPFFIYKLFKKYGEKTTYRKSSGARSVETDPYNLY